MKCAKGHPEARVLLLKENVAVCWSCYNAAVLTSSEKVQARMLRRYYR